MSQPRILLSSVASVAILVLGWIGSAEAANIVYVHGRSTSTWPAGGQLVVSPGWNQIALNFNGSARLGDSAVRAYVRDQIRSACTGTDCVVVCHSAGCARVLLAPSAHAQGVYFTTRDLLTDFFKQSQHVTYKKIALSASPTKSR